MLNNRTSKMNKTTKYATAKEEKPNITTTTTKRREKTSAIGIKENKFTFYAFSMWLDFLWFGAYHVEYVFVCYLFQLSMFRFQFVMMIWMIVIEFQEEKNKIK